MKGDRLASLEQDGYVFRWRCWCGHATEWCLAVSEAGAERLAHEAAAHAFGESRDLGLDSLPSS